MTKGNAMKDHQDISANNSELDDMLMAALPEVLTDGEKEKIFCLLTEVKHLTAEV